MQTLKRAAPPVCRDKKFLCVWLLYLLFKRLIIDNIIKNNNYYCLRYIYTYFTNFFIYTACLTITFIVMGAKVRFYFHLIFFD